MGYDFQLSKFIFDEVVHEIFYKSEKVKYANDKRYIDIFSLG